jgi:pimeloyl-ACP methyl ester carboxylesterase
MTIAVAALLVVSSSGRGTETPSTQPDLKTSAGGVQYYLALPKGWSAEKSWPVVVTIDGAGHNFPLNCKIFAQGRGERPFIIVTPCVSSNGRDPADAKAVLAIVKEVQQSHNGRKKFFITGFSAGGHVTWQFVFNHPELIAGAAPAAANFRYRGIDENKISSAPERETLPIHGFNGEKDLPVINQQWDDAAELARDNGYKNLKHTLVAGAGHTPFVSEVLEFFATLVEKDEGGRMKDE